MPPTSRVSQTWQFVTVNEPKKIQDKDTISTVRAHAMRSVRRKKRLELTAENQKKIEAIAQQSHPADSGVLSHHSVQVYPNDPFVGNRGKPDWLAPQREMLLKLEFLCLGHLPSNGAEYVAYDEYAQRLDYWQSDRDGDTRAAPKHFTHEISTIGSPKSLIGDGVFDPFNVMPISGGANHNSHVLNHCRRLPRNTFLFGQRRMKLDCTCLLMFSKSSCSGHVWQLSTPRPACGSESSQDMASLRFAGRHSVPCYAYIRRGTFGNYVWEL